MTSMLWCWGVLKLGLPLFRNFLAVRHPEYPFCLVLDKRAGEPFFVFF